VTTWRRVIGPRPIEDRMVADVPLLGLQGRPGLNRDPRLAARRPRGSRRPARRSGRARSVDRPPARTAPGSRRSSLTADTAASPTSPRASRSGSRSRPRPRGPRASSQSSRSCGSSTRSRALGAGAGSHAATRRPRRAHVPGSKSRRSAICSRGCGPSRPDHRTASGAFDRGPEEERLTAAGRDSSRRRQGPRRNTARRRFRPHPRGASGRARSDRRPARRAYPSPCRSRHRARSGQ